MANKITTIIDFVTTGAQNSVRGFRQSIADADGTVNKFKAGTSAAMTTLQANAGNLALAGGAALVAFGTKAVTAFQDTAIAAGKFSDATGLAVEDASRWNEVAADVGVSTETIQGAFVRLNNAIGTGKLADLGIELQRTEEGAADVNATMLETIRVIGRIQDPTERAAAAQKAFGRGYAEAAEIILGSADDIEQKLADVSDSKVINEDELRKAREFRESMDNLRDAAEDVGLIVGETLVPVLGDLADVLVDVRGAAGDAKSAIEEIPGGESLLDALGTNLFELPRKSKEEWDELGRKLGIVPDKIAEIGSKRAEFEAIIERTNATADAVGGLGDAAEETADKVNSTLPDALREFHSEAQDAGDAADDFADALEDALAARAEESVSRFEAAIDRVIGKLDEAFEAFDKGQRQQDILADIADGWDEIAEAEQAMLEGGEQERRDYERQVRAQEERTRDLLETIDSLPVNKKIEILAEIQQASLGDLQRIVSNLSAGITVPVSFTPRGATEVTPAMFSSGGITNPTFAAPQTSIPSVPMTVINNYPVGTTPTTQYQNDLTDTRRNGIR